jgi:hypothetical protein
MSHSTPARTALQEMQDVVLQAIRLAEAAKRYGRFALYPPTPTGCIDLNAVDVYLKWQAKVTDDTPEGARYRVRI